MQYVVVLAFWRDQCLAKKTLKMLRASVKKSFHHLFRLVLVPIHRAGVGPIRGMWKSINMLIDLTSILIRVHAPRCL